VLAYATTIHKSQGSEYPAVVILLTTQHYTMLQREPGVYRGDAGQAPCCPRAAEGVRYCGQGSTGTEAVVEATGVADYRRETEHGGF
jgi:hypothetical protein